MQTLIEGRWIPGGIDNGERIAADTETGAEVWLISSTRTAGLLAVIAYSGRRVKHDYHYTMRTREQALKWAAEYIEKMRANLARKTSEKQERKAKRAEGHKLKVGDILRSSWGYDQTSIDYYEVTKLIGARMVEIREISAQSENDGHMTGNCTPCPGYYIGEPMRKMVSDYDGQSVRITSYACAYKIEPVATVGNKKVFAPDHWTAYA